MRRTLITFFTIVLCVVSVSSRIPIAVFDFEAYGVDKDYSMVITDTLVSELVKVKGLALVEREKIKTLIKERQLSQIGITDISKGVELGKLLGVEKIVLGRIGRLGREYILTVKLVDVETGEIEFQNQYSVNLNIKSIIKTTKEIVPDILRNLPLMEGKITDLKGKEVYLNLSSDDGIQKGMVLHVFKLEKHTDEHGEVIFESEKKVGDIEITAVSDRGSIARILKRYGKISIGDTVKLSLLYEYYFKVSKKRYKPRGTAILKIIPQNQLAYGAKVYIDGEEAGTIKEEIFAVDVVPGEHKVEIDSEKIDKLMYKIHVGSYETYELKIRPSPAKRIVKLVTQPAGALVYINGRYIGTSPCFTPPLVVGKVYKLRIEKEGYRTAFDEIKLEEKGFAPLEKRYTLEKLKAVLKVVTTPEKAKVYFNGKYLGETPMKIFKEYQIHGKLVISKEGYKSREEYVNVSPGFVREIRIKLKPIAVLRIRSNPEGAAVFVNDRLVGRTPVEIKLEGGKEVVITLKRSGYETLRDKVVLPKIPKVIEKNFRLKRLKAVIEIFSNLKLKVFLNGEYLGTIPLKIERERAIQGKLVLLRGNKVVYERKINVPVGKTLKLDLKYHPPNVPRDPRPKDGGTSGTSVILSWKCSDPDGEKLVYDVYFGNSHNPPLYKQNLKENSLKLMGLRVGETYYWRVVAIDPTGMKRTGPLWSFKVLAIPGSIRWYLKVRGDVDSSPAIGEDGTVYIGSDDGNLYAISPNGSLKWKFKTSGDVNSSPAVGEDEAVYFGSDDGYLYAVKNGKIIWKFKADSGIDSSPAVENDGTIYFGTLGGYLYAVRNGKLLWRLPLGDSIYSSPAVADGTIYIGSLNGVMYAVSRTGTIKWFLKTHGSIYSSPSIGHDGTVYFGSEDGSLYAVRSDGSIKWKVNLGDVIYSSAAVDRYGNIYIGSWDGYLYKIGENGKIIWKIKIGKSIFSSPAIGDDGNLYVGSWDGYIVSLKASGKVNWKIKLGSSFSSSPSISDGNLYIGSNDGKVYSICIKSKRPENSPWAKFRGNLKNTGLARKVQRVSTHEQALESNPSSTFLIPIFIAVAISILAILIFVI